MAEHEDRTPTLRGHIAEEHHVVGILDPGAQYGKLIDREVRKLGVKTAMVDLDESSSAALEQFDAFIIAGGGSSVNDEDAPKYSSYIFESGKPVLGICYGMHLMVQHHGGTVETLAQREDGTTTVSIIQDSALLGELEKQQRVLMTHGDTVTGVPDRFEVIAKSGDMIAAIADPARKLYGVQFHPESHLTEHGSQILRSFLFTVAGLAANYAIQDRTQEAISHIEQVVGDRDVVVYVSGGVDSTVTALLLAQANIPGSVHAIHVDHGMMRENESEKVEKLLASTGIEITVIDASKQFMDATTVVTVLGKDGSPAVDDSGAEIEKEIGPLSSVDDPEEKRAIVGDTFIEVRDQVMKKLGLDPDSTILAMGTLRPDLIESGSKKASKHAKTIKTHHNDTARVRELRAKGLVLEPLAEFHKDEVRTLGASLGASDDLTMRHPFPGPGLSIRLLCAREAFMDERFEDIAAQLSKFASEDIGVTLLPVRTVGVQGDERTYGYLVALSGAEDWGRLIELADAIPREVLGVNRVVYSFGGKIAASAIREITPTLPSEENFAQLRLADHLVEQVLKDYDLHDTVSQVPVVSYPIDYGGKGGRSIGVRTIITPDFMTGRIAVPGEDLPLAAVRAMESTLLKGVPGISRVSYDLTPKPPATTEWE